MTSPSQPCPLILVLLLAAVTFTPAAAGDWPASKVRLTGELKFKKHVLSTDFYAEGCAVGDVNRNGRIDVIAGPYWYEAPDWKPHELREPKKFVYDRGYSDSFIAGMDDVNGNGWPDLIHVGFPGQAAHWYENPKGEAGHWNRHEIAAWACNESPWIVDFDGNGHLDVVMGFTPATESTGWMVWLSSPAGAERNHWALNPISRFRAPGTHRFAHGLGIGDMNGNGRRDVITTRGWWEAPENLTQDNWTFHPADLGPDCAHMYAYDLNGNGMMDIISSSAHDYGVWWHEQGRDADGKPTWTRHDIYTKVSQAHALILADMNGNGLPDLVTGKRFFAHNGNDPGAHEPAVVMWFEFSRENGRPTWKPHIIDDDSGIGTQFVVADITGNGKLDVITSNKKGTFVLENVTAE